MNDEDFKAFQERCFTNVGWLTEAIHKALESIRALPDTPIREALANVMEAVVLTSTVMNDSLDCLGEKCKPPEARGISIQEILDEILGKVADGNIPRPHPDSYMARGFMKRHEKEETDG